MGRGESASTEALNDFRLNSPKYSSRGRGAIERRRPACYNAAHTIVSKAQKEPVQAVIFDFDGVIADTEPLHFESLRLTREDIGITLAEPDYYANYLGFDDRGCILEALRVNRLPTAESLVQGLMQKKSKAYASSLNEHLVIFPGVREFVEEAAANYFLAIASGAFRSEIEMILEQAGIRKSFRHITSTEDVTNGKPDPEPYLHALAGLNRAIGAKKIPPGACLVVEDSLPGVRAAKTAGMKVLAVANTHTVQDLHEADAIAQSLTEVHLHELRDRLWGR